MSVTAKTAHRRIAMVLGLFLAIHLTTHLTALGGIGLHSASLEFARNFYRPLLIELLLLGAFLTQAILGIRLLGSINKRKRKTRWHWAQFLSGIYLGIFVVLHSGAALLARWVGGIDTNFFWPAGTLVLDPIRYGFAPYYALALIALFAHLAAALHFRNRKTIAPLVACLGPLISVPILLAFSGALYPVGLPPDYAAYFKQNFYLSNFGENQ